MKVILSVHGVTPINPVTQSALLRGLMGNTVRLIRRRQAWRCEVGNLKREN
ncbi:hypothetical protein [Sivoneniella epilithica]